MEYFKLKIMDDIYTKIVKITDRDYFHMIENQVRAPKVMKNLVHPLTLMAIFSI